MFMSICGNEVLSLIKPVLAPQIGTQIFSQLAGYPGKATTWKNIEITWKNIFLRIFFLSRSYVSNVANLAQNYVANVANYVLKFELFIPGPFDKF